MANPPLSTLWRGHTPITDEPGAFRILRQFTVSNSSWTLVDLQSADYAGAADGLAQDMNGATRGIIRAVSVLNNEGTGSNDVEISLSIVGGSPDPLTSKNTALADGPSVEIRFPARLGSTTFHLKSTAGTPTVQLEIWYDVPPAP
jgi:hypothetical protein